MIYSAGRLAVVYHPAGCAVSEPALLHLNKFKFDAAGTSTTFDPEGMAWHPPHGILTVAALRRVGLTEGRGTGGRSASWALQQIKRLHGGVLPSCAPDAPGYMRTIAPQPGDTC